jgi:thiamine kinase-like enzyme
VGDLLFQLHSGLRDYPGSLLSYAGDLKQMEKVLYDSPGLSTLTAAEHALVREQYVELRDAIPTNIVLRPIHGDPHFGNLLVSDTGPGWIDFEGACLGPVEWDLASLPEEALTTYAGHVDRDLLTTFRDLRSIGVVVWCWMNPAPDATLRQAGALHLARLRAGRQH